MTIDRKKLEEAARLVEQGVREGMFEECASKSWKSISQDGLMLGPGSGIKWRIKPQAPREFWVNCYQNCYQGEMQAIHKTREGADKHAVIGRTECVRFREVLEGDDS